MDPILLIALVLGLAILVLLIVLLLRKPADTSALREEMRALRGMNEKAQSLSRQEILSQFKNLNQISLAAISQISSNTGRDLEAMRAAMDRRLAEIQAENEKSLAELRQTVNKNLSETLTDSLAASFQSVSSQLEQVYKSMGEMRSMTADVTDLKRILGNVKNRGTWGEVQLESLLSDILSPSQYAAQLSLSGSAEKVDFAVRLPGDGEKPVYLPIDSKFPMDRYRAVLDAEQYGDDRAKALSRETLLKTVRDEAKKIGRQIYSPAGHHGFRRPVRPFRGIICLSGGGGSPLCAAAGFPHPACRAFQSFRAAQQLPAGLPDAGCREAVRGDSKAAGRGENLFCRLFRPAGEHAEKPAGGGKQPGARPRRFPGHRAPAPRHGESRPVYCPGIAGRGLFSGIRRVITLYCYRPGTKFFRQQGHSL